MVFKSLLLFIAIFRSFSFAQNSIPRLLDPRIHYNMIEIVCSAGYYVQEHKVETDDGYVLTIYRIPTEKRHRKIPPSRHHYQQIHDGYHPDFEKCVNESRHQAAMGPPVLLAHGLLSSSDGWVLQGPNNDLAFTLVDKGYDVWFTNIRGNFYSRKHKTLRPSQPEFWDYSFHENGIYDIPKIIDYILDSSHYQNLTYIGHSMGTTMFFVLASVRPEYNAKINLFVGLAPVSQIRRQSFQPPLKVVLEAVMALMKACYKVGVVEFLPRTRLSDLLFKTVCARGSVLQDLCYDSVLAIFGNPSKLFKRELFSVYLSHALNGVSTKTFLHYDQQLDAPYFQLYDYGPETNLRRYGQVEPLIYNLTNIKIPIALFYSSEDYISRAEDIAHMSTFFSNLVTAREVYKYNHLDFIWAYTAKKLLYPEIMEVISKYSNQSNREDQFDLSTLE